MKTFQALLALTLTVACAPVGFDNLQRTETVDRQFSQMATASGSQRTNLLAARAVREGDQLAICAAIAEVTGGGTLRGEATDYLRSHAVFKLNEEIVLRGAAFAPVYPRTDFLVGKTARCVATGEAWRPEYGLRKLELGIRRGTIKN